MVKWNGLPLSLIRWVYSGLVRLMLPVGLVSIFSAWGSGDPGLCVRLIALSVAMVSYVARGCILVVLSEHVPYRDWSHDC